MNNNNSDNLKGSPPLDQLLENTGGSMFCLVRIAMLRSMEIYEGSKPLVDFTLLDKSTTIALKEISAGKVVLGDESTKGAMKEAKK